MTIQPTSPDELRASLADACARGEKVSAVNLGALDRLVAHVPDDMTVTVEAGITLARLQSELARRGQWLPIDPPNPEHLSIGALLATDRSGPRRFGYGTIRDHLIGLSVALADGRIIRSGGRVVKNVAGYDLAKLFIGSRGSLGIVVEATFKLRPLPEAERIIHARVQAPDDAGRWIDAVLESELTPVILDLHNLPPTPDSRTSTCCLVAGFAGTPEEVAWQVARANELGLVETATLDYETHFWDGAISPQRISVLPSLVVQTVRGLGDVPFVARAGNGVIYCRGGPAPVREEFPVKLMRRLKDEFDPKHILPEFPL